MTKKNRPIRLIAKGGKVALRARKGSNGLESLYLDYKVNNKRYRDFIDLYLAPAKTVLDRDTNKETLRIAESLRAKKELELNMGETHIAPLFRNKVNFIDYFKNFIANYTNRDKRLVESCSNHFFKFIGKDKNVLLCNEIDENFVKRFKSYLESKLNGETPFNYFKKFKKVIKQAVNDNLFQKNPTIGISIKKVEGVQKEILLMDEIQKLAKTYCGNDEVKRAFLFCCVTGLRFCDVKLLTWDKISGEVLKLIQLKTSRPVIVNLNSTALSLLPVRGSEKNLVFVLPSSTACTKVLQTWVKKADINKKITWHCARHSFGTNLLIYGSDLRSASSLLGHSTTRETEKYVRIVDALKEKAVFNLPKIDV